MSTARRKEGVCGVKEKEKEKVGTSPSTHLKSSHNRSSKTSRSLDSSPSEKAVPNYLKPTLSSSLSSGDSTKLHAKKTVSNTDKGLKPNPARRRSFDKPPSPTRASKARGVSPTPASRSSAFAGKLGAGKTNATTSPKGDRVLKGTRDAAVKQNSLHARPVGTLKKSSTATINKSNKTGANDSRKGPKHDKVAKEASDQESSVAASEEKMVREEHEDEGMETQGEIDEDTINHAQQQQQQIEDEAHKIDSPTVVEEAESPVISEQRDADVCEESDDNVSSVESPTLSGQNDASEQHNADNEDANSDHNDDAADADAEVVSQVNTEQQHVESSEPQHDGEVVSVDSPTVPEQDDGEKSSTEEMRSHHHQEEEAKPVDNNAEVDDGEQGAVVEDENAAPEVANGKDGVEEMTSEQRRNKVRALAGAFETVISSQDHK